MIFDYMGNLKDKIRKQNRSKCIGTEKKLVVARGVGLWGLGEKGEKIKQRKGALTEQSGGCTAQHRECRQLSCSDCAWRQVGT